MCWWGLFVATAGEGAGGVTSQPGLRAELIDLARAQAAAGLSPGEAGLRRGLRLQELLGAA
eukprot:8266696-Pyramimonas_sp.AAC.1